MARKTKLTPPVQKRIIKAITAGATHRLACQYAGIDHATFYRWLQAGEAGKTPYRDFRDEVQKAEGQATVHWLEQIEAAAKEGSWQAAAWMLERRYPQEYGRRVQQEHSGTVAHNVGIHLWEQRLQEAHRRLQAEREAVRAQRALEGGHNGQVIHPDNGVLDPPRQGQ